MALIGSELLAMVKELVNVSIPDLVRSAGYASSKMDGTECVSFIALSKALLETERLSLRDVGCKFGKGTRKLSYVATVEANSNLLVKGFTTCC